MAMPAPKIDHRDFEAILKEARALVPFYTPEWTAIEERDPGVALLEIFADQLEGLIRRLNEAPRRNFIAFLNMLGVKLLPAQPARAPLTFLLSTGANEAITIPARSQATATPPEGGDPVVFETEKAILATPAQLQAIFSTVSARDEIFDHTSDLLENETAELFADGEKNRQEHSLYLGHENLFNIKSPVRIELTISPLSDTLAESDPNLVRWEYYGEKEETKNGEQVKILNWHPFDDDIDVIKEPGKLDKWVLKKDNDDEIKPVEINGIESRWIRCTVKSTKIQAVQGVEIDEIQVSVTPLTTSGIDSDMAFYNDTENDLSKPFYPFGTRPRVFDTFYLASQEAFSKKGARICLNISLCKVSIRAPKLRFPHDSDAPVTKVTVTEEIVGITAPVTLMLQEDVAADESVIQLNAVIGLSNNVHLKIGDPNKEEYVIISAISGNTITIKEKFLFSHQQQTVVKKVTINPTTLSTKLASEAEEDHICLDLQSISGFERGDVIQIGDNTDENMEYQIIASISKASDDAILSWEYWNGKGWTAIPIQTDSTNKLSTSGEIEFTCPEDIGTVEVIGQENYWIRTRITSGDYGKEEFKVEPDGKVTSELNFHPPFVKSLKIVYTPEPTFLDSCLTFNNLEYEDQTESSKRASTRFKPFQPMADQHQALYLGFDQAPLEGPISIFFSLVEQEYIEKNRPRIEWEYFRKREGEAQVERSEIPRSGGEWTRLEGVLDGTRNLTESGVIEFIGPPDFAQLSQFGQALDWIRAVDVEDKFQPSPSEAQSAPPAKNKETVNSQESLSCPKIEPCADLLESFHPRFSVSREALEVPAAPRVKGIHLNTALAIQAETIQDEILGSSSGNADQTFTLAKLPVITEEIRVNEIGGLSEGERKELKERKDVETEEVVDETGEVTEFWVLWRPIDDLLEAAGTDRVYEIDRTFSQIQFGDGIHGKVPPIGRDNIRATYQAGGGAKGNLEASLITALRTTIPFIDGVNNPEPAGGGADTELLESALERGPQAIKHRGRAVTVEDFEWLTREASRAITRVKCLPTFNDQGEFEAGWVTVIIVPESQEARPTPSPQLRLRVENYLRDRAANVVSFPEHVQVTGPTYVEVNVAAAVFPTRIDLAPQVETAAFREIRRFLHPLTGGYDNSGWELGRLPCLSDFYTLLETIEGVDHVENLSMTLQAVTPTGVPIDEPKQVTEDRPLDVRMPEYALIYSGDHIFTVKPL